MSASRSSSRPFGVRFAIRSTRRRCGGGIATDRGYPGQTSHALRKTTGDVAGTSARSIAEYLGHMKPSLTQDVHMSRNVGSAEAATQPDRMFGVTPGPDVTPKS